MHIYFSGIGGVGIGPLAMIALDAGYQVSGSDLKASEMTQVLQTRGAQIALGQDGSTISSQHQVQPIDWFVYSSALTQDHPELRFATEHGIKMSKRDEFLNHIITENNLQLVAVTGTHGKTTTTAMLVWVFKQLGLPVSYSIGTSISFGPSAQYQPGSQYFVYECDEFDRNFLNFSPSLSLITAIDYDHPDTYPTKAEYLEAFATFGQRSEQLIAWHDQHGELFTDHPDAWLLQETLPLHVPGEHNRRNGSLVLKAIEKLGISGDAKQVLEQFPGTARRFEKLTNNLYTDYAHHPAEIAATIQLAQEINPSVVIVYQPHQNIRQHELLKSGGYGSAFAKAKKVYWLPTYLSREDNKLEVLTPEELAKDTENAEVAAMNDELWQNILSHQQNDDLVIAMSAGDLDDWLREKATTLHGSN